MERPSLPRWALSLLIGGTSVVACVLNPPPDPDTTTPEATPAGRLRERVSIDGYVDAAFFARADTVRVEFRDDLGSGPPTLETSVTWGVANDADDLYLGVTWSDATADQVWDPATGPVQADGITVQFDDGDGRIDDGEDSRSLVAAFQFSHYVDQHVSATTVVADAVQDGIGRLRYDAQSQTWGAEFLIPLQDDRNGEDGNKSSSSRLAFVLFDGASMEAKTGRSSAPFGAIATGAATQQWPAPLQPPRQAPRPQVLPSDLGGIIVFLTETGSQREVFTFDPSTGAVRQVTKLPGLFKDGLSLSHDRTRVSFHGSPSASDFSRFEIYTVRLDGTDIRRLTNNDIADGHPAWSPGDDRIAYASFRNGGMASIVVMDANGEELADLTPEGVDDNDPEYGADGRIIFKTTRFTAFPQYRMAVMNADGTGVVQLTHRSGTSDHDGVSDGTRVYFERFMRDTHYVDDPTAVFDRWDIIAVGLNGASETTLVADGWVNWLPVPDPSGRYLVYLKSVGYTEARLMRLDGTDYGRLIPGITQISYIDWK